MKKTNNQIFKFSNNRFLLVLFIIITSIFVSVIDYITGTEIRVYPFYFIPVTLAASFISFRFAIFTSIFCTLLWFTSNFYAGMVFSNKWFWAWNCIANFISLLFVSYLVSNLKTYKDQQEKHAIFDSLTGLLNRRAFNDKGSIILELCRRLSMPVTIAFIDLDNFKFVNDNFGHKKGDEVILNISNIIKSNLRASDILCRLGGDEFVAMLPNTAIEGANSVLERIRHKVECEMQKESLEVRCSIGAEVFYTIPNNTDDLINSADKIMYSVKNSGKNRVEVKIKSNIL